ncbi:UspA domain protein [Desulfosarcina cetonica]|uniref:universal stress protein n=1 Tax=Desulfosarcina cetonica TaxID=90730 RepID=UPI0006D08EBD|nr:universal stress protein [Desulfosarcina cetonica]VTR67405.1 UspA domain protein [Desulfosarcina cetonica]
MQQSILVVMNEMPHSTAAIDFLSRAPFNVDRVRVTLMHILRTPTGSEEMMGKKFMLAQQEKIEAAIAAACQRLVEAGYPAENLCTRLETQTYPTVTDGIIAEVEKGEYDMVVISRKRMSRSEEFVLGDASIGVIRALDNTAILVVKC